MSNPQIPDTLVSQVDLDNVKLIGNDEPRASALSLLPARRLPDHRRDELPGQETTR